MSKPVKSLLSESYKKKFSQLSGGVLIDIRGIPSNTNNKIRATLAGKKVKVTVIRNSLARNAFKGTALEPLTKLMHQLSPRCFASPDGGILHSHPWPTPTRNCEGGLRIP